MSERLKARRAAARAAGRRAAYPIVVQAGGLLVALAGVHLLAGLGWSLLIGGVAAAAGGMLKEAGWL